MIKKVPVLRDPGVPRRNNTQQILNAAEKTFSAYGLAGTRVDDIAKACDLPKANILYYFGSKEDLYRATLQRLLSGWLEDADEWISTKYPPLVGLEGYIRAKMKFSRQRADASRLFMHELLAGGDCIKDFLKTTLKNHVAEKKEVFEHWHKEGLFAEVDAAHFLFLLWSMTQAYADMQVQFSSVLGHRLQSADYENGVTMIMRMVGSFCQPSPESDAR